MVPFQQLAHHLLVPVAILLLWANHLNFSHDMKELIKEIEIGQKQPDVYHIT